MSRNSRTEPGQGFRFSKFALATVAVMIGLAAPAHAGSADDDAKFLTALDKAGIGYNSPARAIAVGNEVCRLLAAGQPDAEVTWQLVISNQGVSRDAATEFAAIAASVYCPEYLGNLNGNGTPR